jgi:hypothetical protein
MILKNVSCKKLTEKIVQLMKNVIQIQSLYAKQTRVYVQYKCIF